MSRTSILYCGLIRVALHSRRLIYKQIFTVQTSRAERSYAFCRCYVDQHRDVQLDSTPVPTPILFNGEVELLIDKNDSVFSTGLQYSLDGSRVIMMRFDWQDLNKQNTSLDTIDENKARPAWSNPLTALA